MPAPNIKKTLWDDVVEMSESMSQREVGIALGVHPYTISKWCKEEGYDWPRKAGGRKKSARIEKECKFCGTKMHMTETQASFREFCSRSCTNDWQRQQSAETMIQKTCVCGKQFAVHQSDDKRGRRFCSKSCAGPNQTKRQPDPAKQITFNCGTCGKQITRWKGYGSTISGKRFCDNKCAIKHTKTVRNYVIRESDMVLDSTWEMLFAGLCGYFKIECLRVDRSLATTNAEGRHYAPDFLVDGHLWVEVKGYDANGQASARQGWINQNGPLTVVDRELLDLLRLAVDSSQFMALLMSQVHTTEETQ